MLVHTDSYKSVLKCGGGGLLRPLGVVKGKWFSSSFQKERFAYITSLNVENVYKEETFTRCMLASVCREIVVGVSNPNIPISIK